jgi:AbrB family looped-hinge helix DNA binding protein
MLRCRAAFVNDAQRRCFLPNGMLTWQAGEDRMEARLDKFGRLVIPKTVRWKLGLKPGSTLRMETVGGVIHLHAAHPAARLRVEGGLLIFDGEAAGDLEMAVALEREERLSDLGGGGRPGGGGGPA